MKPRLKTSKKWTAFPKEYLKQIQEVFTEAFAAQMKNAKLIVDGRIYKEEVMLRVGYLEKGRLTQPNFEVSMNFSPTKKDAIERIYNCIDATASMMQDFFDKEGEAELPYTWTEVEFEGVKVFMQFSTENTELEQQANKLLGIEEGEELIHDEDFEDEESVVSQSESAKDPDDTGTRH